MAPASGHRSIRYDQDTGALSIDGPITLTEGGDTVILADAAELDADFQNGLLIGARLILAQQLQAAAAQLDRVDGRYDQLSKASVTSLPYLRRRACPALANQSQTGDP